MSKDLEKVNEYTKLQDDRIVEKEEYRKVKDTALSISKEELPKIIEEEKKKIIEEVISYVEEHDLKRISYAKLYEIMSSGNAYNRTRYSAEELNIAFEVYKSITSDLTLKNPKHTPTKQSFCSFLGISTRTYDSYRQHDDLELVEVVNRIDDYMVDVMLSQGSSNVINAGMSMFRAKTEYGYVEPKEFISVVNEVNYDRGDVKARLSAVKNKSIIDMETKKD